ncbi:GNAT family N-acetyltransferase [Sphingomonas koreensis]|uniref:GNAT family N-acetyltransferase n=1 Tax=Sphingomonas koreensis TaxID=93064 RepID=A0A1L6JFX4_9SPHN|nr:PadR family transcriptional regulator [Sphingomonas koreensis]RSU23057.1 GNAT family N-acetyltransferase [Sphingomonas koreensis]RSU30951.1 GNAT family N-acetyltransferase [Sphingomonas koreensis]RSU32253.1 GNAT family N-acetyltransferase [Sphingomonas koreensis]RSU39506.1 GNAT family N-acetyltransferase [Sphingomonas koreensis]
MTDPICRFRRFARAVTREVGALDTSFLGRGRPLGSARVINAIGSGRSDVADLRAYLDLDSGLMSRLLRGLEDEGLIRTTPHPDDARRRVAVLTADGIEEFRAYEALSDMRAASFLDGASNRDALLDAMDLIAAAFGRELIVIEEVDPVSEAARHCLTRYYAELDARFPAGFEVSRSRDPDAKAMIRPRGAFFVAISDGLPVGCVALKGEGESRAEIKRLWVDRGARGLGLAQQLMAAAEDTARTLHIDTLRLDTNRALPEAERFYRTAGWTEIERYNDNPYAELFFEKRL